MSKITFRNILDTESEFKVIEHESQMLIPTIREYAKTMDEEIYRAILNQKVSIYLNDEMIPIPKWNTTHACVNDEFIIVPNLEGGLLSIAIGAVLIGASNLAVIEGIGYLSVIMFGMGISLVLGGISQLLFQPDLPVISDSGSKTTQTYNWSGIKTTARSDLPIPIVYGTHMVGGNLISLFTESLGENNYLYMLLALCEGEIDGICQEYDNTSVCTTSDTVNASYANPAIKLDDQPFKSFDNVEWWYRKGTNLCGTGSIDFYDPSEQNRIPNFDGARIQHDDGREITYGIGAAGDGIVYTTTKSVDEINVQVRCPALYDASDPVEGIQEHEVKYRVYWKTVAGSYALWEPDAYTPLVQVSTPSTIPNAEIPYLSVRQGITASSYFKCDDYESSRSEYIYSIKRPTYIIQVTNVRPNTTYDPTTWVYYKVYEVTEDGLVDAIGYFPMNIFGNILMLPNVVSFTSGVWNTIQIGDYIVDINRGVETGDVFILSSVIDASLSGEIYVKDKTKTGVWSSVIVPLSELGGKKATYMIKLQRTDATSDEFEIEDKLILNSVTEIVNGNFIYPNTALLGFKIKATEQLSGAPPNVTTILRGTKISVPDLRDAVGAATTVAFEDVFWDDTNEIWVDSNHTEAYWNNTSSWRDEFSDNSVLCVNDLMTDTRYGIGNYVTTDDIYTTSLVSVMKDCHASYSSYNATHDYVNWDGGEDDVWIDLWDISFDETDITASFNEASRMIAVENSTIDDEARIITFVVNINTPLLRGSTYTFSITFGSITYEVTSIAIFGVQSISDAAHILLGSISDKTSAGTFTTNITSKVGGMSALLLNITCDKNISFRLDDVSVTLTTKDHYHTYDGVMDGKQAAPTAMKEMCDSFRTWVSWYNGRFNFVMDKDSTVNDVLSVGDTTEFSESFTPLSEIPYLLIGQYTDDEFNFDMTQILAKSPDSSLNKSNERTIGLKGITNRRKAGRELKHKSRVVSTNIKQIQVKCGIDKVHQTAGDLINIQDSLPSWGHGGRIIDYSYSGKTITIEDNVNFTSTNSATTFMIEYVDRENTTITATLDITVTGEQQELSVKTWEGTPATYSMFALGNEDTYVKPFRIIDMSRVDKNDVEFSAIEHNSGVYTATDSIVIDKPNYSSLPNPLAPPGISYVDIQIADVKQGVGFSITTKRSDNSYDIVVQMSDADDGIYSTITTIPSGSNSVVYIDNNLRLNHTYYFKLFCRSVYRSGQPAFGSSFIDKDLYAPNPPTGVYIKGYDPNDTDSSSRHLYDGKDVSIAWNPLGILFDQQVTMSGYKINIYKDTTNNSDLLRTEIVADSQYKYTYEMNIADAGTTVANNNLIFELYSLNKFTESLTSTTFNTHNEAPSAPTGLSATAVEDGVTFEWTPNTETDVLKYTYRLQVESDGWSSWQETFGSYVTKRLTTTELVAQAGGRSNIDIEVKAVDVYDQQSTASATNGDCKNEKSYFTVHPTAGVGHFQYIQDAINNVPDGSTIVLKEGTYDLANETGVTNYSDGVVFPTDKSIRITGSGQDSSIVVCNDNDNAFNMHNFSDKVIYLSSFQIYGDTDSCKYLILGAISTTSFNIILDDMYFKRATYNSTGGVYFSGGIFTSGYYINLTVKNCKFLNCHLRTSRIYNLIVEDNEVDANGALCLAIEGKQNINTIINNKFLNYTQSAIYGNSGTIITNCTIDGNVCKSVTDNTAVANLWVIMPPAAATSKPGIVLTNNSIEVRHTNTTSNTICIYLVNCLSGLVLSNNSVDVNISSSGTVIGIHHNSPGLGTLSGNTIRIDNDNNTGLHKGILIETYGNKNIGNNTIDMVNSDSTKDITMHFLNSDNNNISSNILQNYGILWLNNGTGNIFINNIENGVNQPENSYLFTNEMLNL